MSDLSKCIRFAKTPIGEAEVKAPVLLLTGAARALLVAVDLAVPMEQCLLRSRARLSDAVVLLTYHLINATAHPAEEAHDAGHAQRLVEALLDMPGIELYSFLTLHGKHHLGLMQGFRLILALEQCESERETQALAIDFVQRTWQHRGAQGLASLGTLLGPRMAKLRAASH